MSVLRASLISGAVALAGMLMANDASAGARLNFDYYPYYPRYRTFYPGPLYVPRPRYYYYYRPYYRPYEPDYYEERSYQEPEYVPRKRKKRIAPEALQIPDDATEQQEQQQQRKPKAKSAQPAKSGGPITCAKASQIVAGYGFGGIKPQTCAGKEYAFNASRDGKSYVVKLSSASGELTSVKKQ